MKVPGEEEGDRHNSEPQKLKIAVKEEYDHELSEIAVTKTKRELVKVAAQKKVGIV